MGITKTKGLVNSLIVNGPGYILCNKCLGKGIFKPKIYTHPLISYNRSLRKNVEEYDFYLASNYVKGKE